MSATGLFRAVDCWKWSAIGCVVLVPHLWLWGMALLLPGPTSRPEEKASLLARRPGVDTVVVGDSRVMLLGEVSFAQHGWKFFNMGLNGISPEDTALELKYVLTRASVRRVIMGVSFEGMNERVPFENCSYQDCIPFNSAAILDFATVEQRGVRHGLLVSVRNVLGRIGLPAAQAHSNLMVFLDSFRGGGEAEFLPDGSTAYSYIRDAIRTGRYDFERERDPSYFFRYDAVYRKTRCLASHAKLLPERIFRTLGDARITCVVFETGRIARYQRLIDADPLLSQLQRERRGFFAAQSYGSVKFLDVASLDDCYRDDDAVDACHYIGGTPDRLGSRLALELNNLEQSRDSSPGAPPNRRLQPN